MYLEMMYVEEKLKELRGPQVRRHEPCSQAGLPGAEIPRKNVGIRHEVFRRIIGQ